MSRLCSLWRTDSTPRSRSACFASCERPWQQRVSACTRALFLAPSPAHPLAIIGDRKSMRASSTRSQRRSTSRSPTWMPTRSPTRPRAPTRSCSTHSKLAVPQRDRPGAYDIHSPNIHIPTQEHIVQPRKAAERAHTERLRIDPRSQAENPPVGGGDSGAVRYGGRSQDFARSLTVALCAASRAMGHAPRLGFLTARTLPLPPPPQ